MDLTIPDMIREEVSSELGICGDKLREWRRLVTPAGVWDAFPGNGRLRMTRHDEERRRLWREVAEPRGREREI